MERQRSHSVIGPAGVTFLSILSFTFVFPLYPQLQEHFGFTTLMVSVAAALSALPQIVLGPFLGVAQDRYGRKAVLLPALVTWLLGALVQTAGLYTGGLVYPLFLTGRVLQAAADAALFPVALSLVADSYQGSPRIGWAMATLESGASLGGIVGPMLTAAVLPLGIWAPSALTGLFGLLLTLWLAISVPGYRPQRPVPLPEQLRQARPLLGRPRVLGIFLTGLFTMFTLQGVQTFLGFLLRDRYALGSGAQGVLLSIVPWAMLAGAQLIPVLSRRYGWQRLMSAALAFSVLLFLFLAMDLSWPALTGGLLTGGLALGGVLPLGNSGLAAEADPGTRGALMSVYSSTRLTGSLIAPLLLGPLLPSGYMTTYLGGAAAATVIALAATSLLRSERAII